MSFDALPVASANLPQKSKAPAPTSANRYFSGAHICTQRFATAAHSFVLSCVTGSIVIPSIDCTSPWGRARAISGGDRRHRLAF
jgi:hypothetical protein